MAKTIGGMSVSVAVEFDRQLARLLAQLERPLREVES